MKKITLTIVSGLLRQRPLTVLGACSLVGAMAFPVATHAQENQSTVTGQIKDENGEPMPGVAVRVKGANRGTITDVDGKFSLQASESDVLEIKSLGYADQEVSIKGQSDLTISLSVSKTNSLNDVVVVGYGTQKKSDVTGSTVSVGAKTIQETPVANTAQALQGRASGVNIQYSSSRPGADATIRVRGERSLTSGANNPLIVLDGIPFSGSINDINTNDIKSIDILKDASSTAIYGSRGANGVIIITTNKGIQGKPVITYSGYQGISTVAKKYPVYNGEEFNTLRNIANLNKDSDPTKATYVNSPEEAAQLAAGKTTDWQDLMYKKAIIGDHQVGISGGTENTKYSLGLGYHNESAVVPGQDFTRYSLHMSVEQNIGKRIIVGATTQTNYSIIDGESASLQNALVTMSPLAPAYDSTGKLYTILPLTTQDKGQYYNPLIAKNDNNWIERRKRLGSYNSVYGEVKILEGLKFRTNIGLNFINDNYGKFVAAVSPYNSVGQPNYANISNSNTTSFLWENILYYDKTIGKHKFGVTGLYSMQQDKTQLSAMSVQNIVSDQLQYYNLGLANNAVIATPSAQSDPYRGLLSYMVRLNYGYDDRYLVTFTARRDGSSALQSHWNNYPAIGAAWNISNESFMSKSKSWLDALKLRAGYGVTANQSITPYTSLGSLTQSLYNFGTTNAYGYYVSTLPNSTLGWENSKTINLGLDFAMFNNRISGTLELYSTKTDGVLLPQQLPATSGVPGSYLTNAGSTQNKGIEFNVSTVNVQTKSGFSWRTDFNIFMNRNKIVSLASGVTQDIGNGWFVGQPMDVIYDYNKLGIWQTNEAAQAATYGEKPGMIKVEDVNGDGKIDGSDQMVVGNFQPSFQGGITNKFAYKAFDLTVVMYGRVGGDLVSTIHQPQSYANTLSGRRNGIKVDYWTPDNPTGDNPMPLAPGDNPQYSSTLGYFNASYLQIRTISLGYHLKDSWMKKIGASNAYIYATVNNVGTLFSPYMKAGGVSPEANGTGFQGNGTQTAAQQRQYTIGLNTPPMRSFLIGVRFTY